MESTTENETIQNETQDNANLEGQGGNENTEGNQSSQEQVQPTEADIATAYLKSQGFEFENIEDLKKVPEKIIETKEVNPYEDILDDEDKAYLNYKKETKGSRADYEKANVDLNKIPKIELARERVRTESGNNFSDEEIDSYLTDTLGIDLEDMTASDEIKLAKFTKEILEAKRAEQEKYKNPVDKSTETEQTEYVKLDNGSIMRKQDYEKLEVEQSNFEKNRLANIEKAKEVVNSVTAFDFDFEIDDNGTIKTEKFTFEVSDKDKQSMLSNVSDMKTAIEKTFGSGDNVDHKKLQKALWLINNEGKLFASFKNKVKAEVTEEVLKQRGNVNFTSNNALQTQNRDGVKMVSFGDILKNI